MSKIESNIFYCTICQFPEEALPNAYRVRSYVNEIIVVHNKPVLEQVKAEFDELEATLHYVDWKEDFSYKRTQYIRKTGEIIKEKGDYCGYTKNNTWMLVSDIDEFPSISLLSNLQNIIAKAEIEKSSICTINSHDIFIKGEGTFTFIPIPLEEVNENDIISSRISNYFKELLVKYQDKLEYTGKVHHTLRGSGLRIMQASKDYYYDHVKKDTDLHSHGCRNWFIGGGGVQEFGPKWKVLRSITDKYGLDSWEKMEKAMIIGNLYPDILQFFVDHKDDNDTSSDSELRSFHSYYKILHSKELEGIIQNVKTVVTKEGIKSPIPESQKILQKVSVDNKDVNYKNGLYYDPSWKKDYSIQSKNSEKLIDTSKPLYNNPQKSTGNYIEDMSYHFQEVKVSSDSSNTPKTEVTESESEIREFVENKYWEILGREGDIGGVNNYTKEIKEGRLKKENITKIFRNSEEYLEKRLET